MPVENSFAESRGEGGISALKKCMWRRTRLRPALFAKEMRDKLLLLEGGRICDDDWGGAAVGELAPPLPYAVMI